MSASQPTTGPGPQTAPAPSSASQRRYRLLLIQDDPRARIALWDKLKNAGFDVECANNAHVAMEKLRLTTPEVIFMDLVQPFPKGPDLIKEARRHKSFGERPIYICTNAANVGSWKKGGKAGATRVLDKTNTSIDEVIAELARLAGQFASASDSKAPEAKAAPTPKAGSPTKAESRISLNPLNLFKRLGSKKTDSPETKASTNPAPNPPTAPPSGSSVSASPQPAPPSTPTSPPAAPKPSGDTESRIADIPLAGTRFASRPVVGVFTADAAGKIVSADGAAATMFGWQAADLVGKDLRTLLKEGSETELAKIIQDLGNSSQQLISVNATAQRKDGTEFPVSITRLAWSSDTVTISKANGGQYTWTAVFRDLRAAAGGNTALLAAPCHPARPTAPAPRDELAESKETQEMLRGANQALQKQLDMMSAKVAASAASAHKVEHQREELKLRVKTLEEEIASLRSASKSTDTQVRSLATEKFELQQKLEEQKRAQQQSEQLSAALAEAKAAAARAEENAKKEAARARSLDEENGRLRQSHEQLISQTREQCDEIEGRLRDTSAKLNHARAEQEKREADLKAQLAAAQQAASAGQEKAEQCNRLQSELATLQRVHQELSGNFTAEQRTTAESRRRAEELERQLRETNAELHHLKEASARSEEGRSTLESTLHTQLTEARMAAEQAAERAQRLEDDLAALRQQNDEYDARFTRHNQSAAELERRNQELEAQLKEALARQVASTPNGDTSIDQPATGRRASDTSKRLEREVANLRQERHELHAKCVAEKQAGTKAKRRIKELEKQLREIAGGFNTAKAELEKRAADRGRLESGLQKELEAAQQRIEQAITAQHEQTVRANLLEKELGQVCEARDELQAELDVEQHKVLASAQRLEELEARLRESAAELARARAAAEHNTGAAGANRAFEGDAEGVLKDLLRLRENEAAHAAEVTELERRVRDGVASLARVTTDLESERTERRRVEQRLSSLTSQLEQMHLDLKQQLESERSNQGRVAELEQQLRERERMLVRLRADLQKESANRDLAEQQLQAVGDMGAQLRQYLALFEESKKIFKRTQEQLESKLKTTQESLGESEARLQKEISERRGLEASLSAAQRSLNDQYEQKVLELARLQSELQVEQLERKRLEGEGQQSRLSSLDSARVARTMLNSLRRQLHETVDTLMQTTRSLLQISPDGEQKKLVQSVLENVLVLQATLDETGNAGTDPEVRKAA